MYKVLFLRGMGLSDVDLESTNLYLTQLENNLNKILEPHLVELVKLTSSSNYEEYYPYLSNLDLSSYDLIIGYSSGANAIMRIAENFKLKNVLLIAASFTDDLIQAEKDTGWFNKPWKWNSIKENVENLYQLASTNDPYISLRESRIIHKKLKSVYFQLDKQNHFSNWFKLNTFESTRLKLLVEEILKDEIPYKDQLRE